MRWTNSHAFCEDRAEGLIVKAAMTVTSRSSKAFQEKNKEYSYHESLLKDSGTLTRLWFSRGTLERLCRLFCRKALPTYPLFVR
jgi:hypothetical protein